MQKRERAKEPGTAAKVLWPSLSLSLSALPPSHLRVTQVRLIVIRAKTKFFSDSTDSFVFYLHSLITFSTSQMFRMKLLKVMVPEVRWSQIAPQPRRKSRIIFKFATKMSVAVSTMVSVKRYRLYVSRPTFIRNTQSSCYFSLSKNNFLKTETEVHRMSSFGERWTGPFNLSVVFRLWQVFNEEMKHFLQHIGERGERSVTRSHEQKKKLSLSILLIACLLTRKFANWEMREIRLTKMALVDENYQSH